MLTQRDRCTLRFIAVLGTIAKLCREPRCTSIDEWVKEKNIYVYVYVDDGKDFSIRSCMEITCSPARLQILQKQNEEGEVDQ